ncbi:hypothetical protein [Candidatus Binatus soli]|jgi:hypothetical protein|uniref:hypothetical protein n=1 Tax=Candidatus Binatus soli TaxID=1953413 RepID=UPI003D146AF2
MLERRTLFLVVAFFLTVCPGQGNARSFTYRLHKPQNNQEFSTLHSMPDGALLVVTKQREQPKQIWKLRRIADWATSQPREDELDVDVGPNDEPIDSNFQGDRVDRNDQLLMDPAANYLVVRLSQNADKWNEALPGESAKPLSVLNIIDLHGFKLLSRVVVTDPLLAAGDMGFSPSGAFVVSGLQEYKRETIDGNVTLTGQYAVETLTLPGLKPETVCTYTIINKLWLAESASTPEEKACGPKLAPLGFSSLDDLHNNLNPFGRMTRIAAYSRRVPPQSPWGCTCPDLSGDLRYELLDCDQSHVMFELDPSYYRGFRVFKLANGTQIMDLKLPRSNMWGRPQFSGVLATSGEVTYVVLLRDGAELEGYRVP